MPKKAPRGSRSRRRIRCDGDREQDGRGACDELQEVGESRACPGPFDRQAHEAAASPIARRRGSRRSPRAGGATRSSGRCRGSGRRARPSDRRRRRCARTRLRAARDEEADGSSMAAIATWPRPSRTRAVRTAAAEAARYAPVRNVVGTTTNDTHMFLDEGPLIPGLRGIRA